MVYSDGRMNNTVFNTDGMAFMMLISDCERKCMFSIENSPYDMLELEDQNDFDEVDHTKEELVASINTLLKQNSLEARATVQNTLFVRQL